MLIILYVRKRIAPTPSTHYAYTHVRAMRKKHFYNKVTTLGAALKGKNLVSLGANSFL